MEDLDRIIRFYFRATIEVILNLFGEPKKFWNKASYHKTLFLSVIMKFLKIIRMRSVEHELRFN